MINIYLDKDSPATNFLLGVLLSGGNTIDFAKKMADEKEKKCIKIDNGNGLKIDKFKIMK